MRTEIEKIVSLLKQNFEKGAWHGPTVKESLHNISGEQALKRLSNTHSIAELVAHMTVWRVYVIRKLQGQADYKVQDEVNFRPLNSWAEALQQLDSSQRELLAELENFPDDRLQEDVPGSTSRLSFYTLLHSIIHHDLYHAGQIILINKATRTQTF